MSVRSGSSSELNGEAIESSCIVPGAAGPTVRKSRKNLHVSFGIADVYDTEWNNLGRKPDTSHDLTYRHSHDYSLIDPRVDEYTARSKAISWHEIICAEYGLSTLFNKYSVNEGKIVCSDHTPRPVASAIYEPGIRRWLVDTGCPFDLIAHGELDSNELGFLKTAS